MIRVAISLWGKCLTEYKFPNDWGFLKYFSLNNLELVHLDDKTAKILVCFDHYDSNVENFPWFSSESRILVCFEPRAVHPRQHTSRVRSKYGRTIVASPRQVVLPTDRVILPGTLPSESDAKATSMLRQNRQVGSVAVLNENKFSFVPGNLYKYRVEAMRGLANSGFSVHLGGGTWNKGIFYDLKRQVLALGSLVRFGLPFDIRNLHFGIRPRKNLILHGRVPDVFDFYSKSEYALVIENDPDYVSEKLFNAIQARCVPIFKGPSLEEFGLPKNLAIEISGGPTSVANRLSGITESEKKRVLDAGAELLEDQTLRSLWSQDRYSQEIAREIRVFAEKKLDL